MDKEHLAENILSFVPLMMKRFTKGFSHAQISRQQFELLFLIQKFNGKSMSFFSKKMMVSKPNLTTLSDKLIQEGWIERVFDPRDRRIICLTITDKGKKFITLHKNKMKQLLVKNFEGLTVQDIQRLNELLEEMRSIFDKIQGGC